MGRWAMERRLWVPDRAVSVSALGVLVTVCLVVLAVRADLDRPGGSLGLTVVDVAVGVEFVVASAAAPGSGVLRGLFAAVGATWSVGSFVPEAILLHQGVLVVALVMFPTGRLRGFVGRVFVVLAVLVALQLVSQLWVAVLFVGVAVTALASPPRTAAAVWYPAAAGLGVAVVLGASWSVQRFDAEASESSVALWAYMVVLGVVAAAYPFACRAVIAGRTRLTDQVLADAGFAGLKGLATVLQQVLRDPELRIYRWCGPELGYADRDGHEPVGERDDRRWVYVDDGESTLAAIEYRSATLDDEPTAAAVSAAVRLAALNERLQDELAAQLDDLEAARARLVDAADRQRVLTATRLHAEVMEPLERATAELRGIEMAARGAEAGEGVEAVGIVVGELTTAADQLAAIVGGVAPARLGDGRLSEAVKKLARRSPVPATVMATPAAASEPENETTLFYVCSEALTNTVKHAGATTIVIALDGDEQSVTATISDDGCGGADGAGSGLQGLADRLAARGGRLRVDSPPGAGTTVTATIPR